LTERPLSDPDAPQAPCRTLLLPLRTEDLLFAARIGNRGISEPGDIAAGVFLTDIEANEDGVFAVTANLNDPANPTDDRDEVRVYSRDGAELTLEAAVQTPGFPPSFKQIATARGRGGKTHVVTTAFQAGWLRSFLFNEDGDDDEDDQEPD